MKIMFFELGISHVVSELTLLSGVNEGWQLSRLKKSQMSRRRPQSLQEERIEIGQMRAVVMLITQLHPARWNYYILLFGGTAHVKVYLGILKGRRVLVVEKQNVRSGTILLLCCRPLPRRLIRREEKLIFLFFTLKACLVLEVIGLIKVAERSSIGQIHWQWRWNCHP